jgi:hypothetical protein
MINKPRPKFLSHIKELNRPRHDSLEIKRSLSEVTSKADAVLDVLKKLDEEDNLLIDGKLIFFVIIVSSFFFFLLFRQSQKKPSFIL